jgi:arsenate reductase
MNILFLCVANSARSQMAEGLGKEILGPEHDIRSAGSNASGKVHPNAILALEDIGIDISSNQSKNIDELDQGFLNNLDWVITLCAEEICPVFLSNASKLHWANEDPANELFSDQRLKEAFEETRNNISKSLKHFYELNLQ